MEKYYLCIVKGKLERTQKVSAYLKKDEKTNKVKVSKQEIAGASHIETAYEPVISNDEFTLLKVELITGKTHQIRAHLASIGHPLIGDFKYGDKKNQSGDETEIWIKRSAASLYRGCFSARYENMQKPIWKENSSTTSEAI